MAESYIEQLQRRLRESEERERQFREALHKYGKHLAWCNSITMTDDQDGIRNNVTECECGFANISPHTIKGAALTQPQAKEQP